MMSKRVKKGGKDIDLAAIESLFKELADEDDTEIISMEGIGKMCESLGMDPASDVRGLVLVWRLGAKEKPGQISHAEFVEGMRSLGVSDTAGLLALLPSLDPGFLERSEFRGNPFVFYYTRKLDFNAMIRAM